MQGVIEIPAQERGVIRIFDLEMPAEQALFLQEPGALAQLLGIDDIDLSHVEIFPVSDLDELGLAGYLLQGCGLTEAQITPDRDRLSALTGHVLLLRSRAFGDRALRLTPAAQIIPVASYGETPVDWTAPPQAAPESSKLYSGAKPSSPRATRAATRRIGASLFAVVVLLFAFVFYMLVF